MNWKTKEDEMFSYLKDKYIPDLSYSEEGQFSPYDCYSVEKNCEVELKYRHRHYDDLLIEKIKYDKLMARAAKHNTEAVYVSETPEGVFAFNLSKLPEPSWFMKKLPATSNFENQKWIDKKVAVINVSHGKRI